MKKIIVLLFLICAEINLCSKPVGLANCGNTCFQNAFIQMMYQIVPLIDILKIQQNFYPQNSLGYTFQHLIWDIINAQNKNLECEFQGKSTNLKKLTEGIYVCMGLGTGRQGDLSEGFINLMKELKKTSYPELVSVLSMTKESTIYIPGAEPYVIPRITPTEPSILLDDLSGPQDLKNYINKVFITKKLSWLDPRTGIMHENVNLTYKLLSAPSFIVFAYRFSSEQGFGHLKNTFFPDELNLTRYIKENARALYQLRAIGVHIPFGAGGHYIAVVRDRDEKLYRCDDSNIKQVDSWQEGIGTHNPAAFLYVLKKQAKEDSSALNILIDKLKKLQQNLKNLECVLISM